MSVTSNTNLLQPTGFRIVIERAKYGNLEFFAQSVTHPGSTATPFEMPVPKTQRFPVAADTIEYSDLSISLILDEDMVAYKEMQDWMQRTVDSSEDLSHDITIIILTSHNNANIKITYEGCLPTQIGSVELNATAGDVAYITYEASFRFTKFTIS
jgi:hypothetical protein